MFWLASLLLPAVLTATATGPSHGEAQLIFAGDAMMHQAQLDASLRSDGTYDFSDCFTAIAPEVSAADFAVVNLETPLSAPPYSGYPCFNAPASYASALADAGFDLFLTANNHTLDRQSRGLAATIGALDSIGVHHLGTYRSADSRNQVIPMLHDIAGFRVGFLNYTYGTNGFVEQPPVIVDRISLPLITADINATRQAGAEIIIVCIHWGDEYHLLPNASQQSTARQIIDAGADIIIGAHPHVIQPMVMSEKSGRPTLTVYSLGNLISNMRTTDTRGGALVRVSLRRDSTGRAIVGDAAYRLVIVQPGQPGKPFRVIPAVADSLLSPATQMFRDNFTKSARKIFNGHNSGVIEDTLQLRHRWGKQRRKSLIQLEPYRQTAHDILRPHIGGMPKASNIEK